ncbi:MAG: Helicase conserved C-terminal domain [Fibrobacterota bacterium]|jgi:hypothetical protein
MTDNHKPEISIEEIEAEIQRRLQASDAVLAKATGKRRGSRTAPEPIVVTNTVSLAAGKIRKLLGQRLKLSGPALPVQRFSFPILLWDAWITLHHLSKEPLKLNQDDSIPVRWMKPLESRLVPIPDWLGIDGNQSARHFSAFELLRSLDCIHLRKSRSYDVEYLLTAGAHEILKAGWEAFRKRSLRSRLLSILDPGVDHLPDECGHHISHLQWTIRIDGPLRGLGQILSKRVLECLPSDGTCLRSDIVEAFKGSDPFIPQIGRGWEGRSINATVEEFLERLPPNESLALLGEAIVHPVLFGILETGFDAQGQFTMGFSADGRAYLGLEPLPAPKPDPHIYLTPAYDLVFGKPDPQTLAWCSLFAELTGLDHGVVAKVTAASVQRALALGVEIRQILSILDSMLAAPLPDNVRVTIDGWTQRARPVQVTEGFVLACPEESVASTLERMAKGQAQRLSSLHLLVSDKKLLTALRKKAAEQGILL